MFFQSSNKTAKLFGGCLLLAACSVFLPKPTDSIIFSHSTHLEEDIDCDECHDSIEKDAEQTVQAIPHKPQCMECHEDEDAKNCGKCHTNVKTPSTWDRPPPTYLIFSHQRHLERKAACQDCHKGIKAVHDISIRQRVIPQHKECKSCHEDDLDSGRCRLCHQRLDLYQRKPESLYSHKEGFFDRHGKVAIAGSQDHCAVCHDQAFCTDCHAGTMTLRPSIRFPEKVSRTFFHRGDWISRHVVESRSSDVTCMKCHGRSSCAACHERNGIGARLGKSPHSDQGTTKWAPDSIDSPDFNCDGDFLHSRAARRRISECASCHDQGPVSICVRCHRDDGRGCKPHPPGWEPPIDVSQRSSNQMCTICHR